MGDEDTALSPEEEAALKAARANRFNSPAFKQAQDTLQGTTPIDAQSLPSTASLVASSIIPELGAARLTGALPEAYKAAKPLIGLLTRATGMGGIMGGETLAKGGTLPQAGTSALWGAGSEIGGTALGAVLSPMFRGLANMSGTVTEKVNRLLRAFPQLGRQQAIAVASDALNGALGKARTGLDTIENQMPGWPNAMAGKGVDIGPALDHIEGLQKPTGKFGPGTPQNLPEPLKNVIEKDATGNLVNSRVVPYARAKQIHDQLSARMEGMNTPAAKGAATEVQGLLRGGMDQAIETHLGPEALAKHKEARAAYGPLQEGLLNKVMTENPRDIADAFYKADPSDIAKAYKYLRGIDPTHVERIQGMIAQDLLNEGRPGLMVGDPTIDSAMLYRKVRALKGEGLDAMLPPGTESRTLLDNAAKIAYKDATKRGLTEDVERVSHRAIGWHSIGAMTKLAGIGGGAAIGGYAHGLGGAAIGMATPLIALGTIAAGRVLKNSRLTNLALMAAGNPYVSRGVARAGTALTTRLLAQGNWPPDEKARLEAVNAEAQRLAGTTGEVRLTAQERANMQSPNPLIDRVRVQGNQ